MAAPSRPYTTVNGGVHQDAQKNQYAGPIYHNYAGSPVSDVSLLNHSNAGQRHEIRPMQSVQVVLPSPHHSSNATPAKATSLSVERAPVSIAPPVDYQLLLLSLAEDYFAAAHHGGSIQSLVLRQSSVTEYQKLIATGLSCLEASLKHWRLQPLLEARVRLRYATILHEETNNSDDAEETLSKAIIICDRLRDFDLKYNLQHLLARVLCQRNPRAAFKYLDGLTEDVEAYQHVVWVYAFRFLRVSLSLEFSSHQEVVSALSHLRSISDTAKKYGDAAVGAIATTLEALVHLRDSGNAESIDQAQRAIAIARSSQLDPAVKDVPKLVTMTHFVDLCWSLRRFDPAQAMSKMQAMQATLEVLREPQSLADDGFLLVPVYHGIQTAFGNHDGAVRKGQDGTQLLAFKWIPNQDIFSLGYLLSGICIAHKNAADGQKSESFLHEGIRTLTKQFEKADGISQSISAAASWWQRRQQLKAHMHLHLSFALCARTAWVLAQEQLQHVKAAISALDSRLQNDLQLTTQYLEGVIYQGAGDLDSALSIFQSPSLGLAQINRSAASQVQFELSIVSALNTILIFRSRSQNFTDISRLLEHLEPLCTNSPNKSIQTAYQLVIATVSAPDSIVRTKQCLQYALQSAKACGNKQLLYMTLNFLSWKFFKGVVGEQAEKSARTSHYTAKMGMDRLWTSVSAGVLGDALEVQGRIQEAEAVKAEGISIAAGLPKAVQRIELAEFHGNSMEF